MAGQEGAQLVAIGDAILLRTQRVQFQRHLVAEAEFAQQVPGQCDRLDIGERLVAAQDLDIDLVELAQPALLRPLVAEHRPAIEQLDRPRQRLALVDEGTRDSGRRLGAQGRASHRNDR